MRLPPVMGPVLVHEVAGGDVRKAVVLEGLPVGLAGVAPAGVGGVALHDGAVQLLNQGGDEGGLEEVVAAGLAGGDLHGHLALEADAQGVIDLLEGSGGDFLRKINLCLFHILTPLDKKI